MIYNCSTCGTSRPLQKNRTHSLWSRQKLSDSYHCPIQPIVMFPLPTWATWSTTSCQPLGKVCGPLLALPHKGLICTQPTSKCIRRVPFPNQSAGQQAYCKTSPLPGLAASSVSYHNKLFSSCYESRNSSHSSAQTMKGGASTDQLPAHLLYFYQVKR